MSLMRPMIAMLAFAAVALVQPMSSAAQGPEDAVASLKKALAANEQRLRQYQWSETTTVSLKGEAKSKTVKACAYGPDGKVQKQPVGTPPPASAPGGVKGKIVARKKEDLQDYMQQAAALVHQYVPPDPGRIGAAKSSGNLSVAPVGGGVVRVEIRQYLKPGDVLAISIDTKALSIREVRVSTWLGSQSDTIDLTVTYAGLPDGTNYAATSTLVAAAKDVTVLIANAGHHKSGVAARQVPPPAAQGAAPSPQTIDALTAPIALYPDALVAQILTASTTPDQVGEFAQWAGQNANLKGSALQDAAAQAGFAPCFLALAPFPSVFQMMASSPDWTAGLGQAFAADKGAVFASIQRLRAAAQAAGNLQSNEQQEVVVESTSNGQQVIVIQPANPQVVYVPVYNTQTVYTTAPQESSSAGAAAAIGFTAGIVIGAAASNNYYYGPYAWHGAALYDEAWDNRMDYAEQRQDYYQQNSANRQDNYQQNSANRQAQQNENAAGRQAQQNENAAGRQAQQNENASGRQAQQNENAAGRQAQQNQNAAGRQAQGAASANRSTYSGTAAREGGGAAAQRGGAGSGGFSGFQGGAATRAESARGQRSLGSGGGGRSFGGGGRGGGGGGGGRRRG